MAEATTATTRKKGYAGVEAGVTRGKTAAQQGSTAHSGSLGRGICLDSVGWATCAGNVGLREGSVPTTASLPYGSLSVAVRFVFHRLGTAFQELPAVRVPEKR
jgi:hypothetical protein